MNQVSITYGILEALDFTAWVIPLSFACPFFRAALAVLWPAPLALDLFLLVLGLTLLVVGVSWSDEGGIQAADSKRSLGNPARSRRSMCPDVLLDTRR